jgi:hypothetical protein
MVDDDYPPVHVMKPNSSTKSKSLATIAKLNQKKTTSIIEMYKKQKE